MSNSQITKLGERLRAKITKEDLCLLDEFRNTFRATEEKVFKAISSSLGAKVKITKRNRKTRQSIIDKLCRQQNLRLPQMQDIVGCRIVINGGLKEAQKIKDVLKNAFEKQGCVLEIKDRHSHGYRAIHIIVKCDIKFYEIQLRTFAQDIWANIIENQADETNSLKYGGSPKEQALMKKLIILSDKFYEIDQQNFDNIQDYTKQIEKEIKDVLSY